MWNFLCELVVWKSKFTRRVEKLGVKKEGHWHKTKDLELEPVDQDCDTFFKLLNLLKKKYHVLSKR